MKCVIWSSEKRAEKTKAEVASNGIPWICGLEEGASVKEIEKRYKGNSQIGGQKTREFGSQTVPQGKGDGQQR